MPAITKKVSDFTAHNTASNPNYNQAHFPTLFTGKTNHDGTIFACDASKMDDSQNASAPIVISKESLRNLMPAGWTGRIACHSQWWFGRSNHPDIGLNQRDPATAQAIINDLVARGYDVIIPDWYHPTKTNVLNDSDVDLIASCCRTAGLKFMVMIDQQYFGNNGSTAATMQADIISAINHLMDKYAAHPNYELYNKSGTLRPLILLWNVASVAGANVDWNAVKTAVASHHNPLLIHYQASGFTVAGSDGALSWEASGADSAGNPPSGVSYLTNSFLPACSAHQDKVCVSSVCKGFNGTLTGPRPTASGTNSWSLGKYLDQQDGYTWLDWWRVNREYVAGGKRLDYVATVTLDDYQEGSPVLCGIRTAVKINASMANGVVTFSLTGDERTVRQYNLWGTMDGVNAVQLASVLPGGAKQFDLSKLPGLTSNGSYTLYVEAQGMPSLENQMAPQTFTAQLSTGGVITPDNPPPPPPPPTTTGNAPVAIISADGSSGINPFTVNFDASDSHDANGTITQYRFDFGDGAAQVDVSTTASHTYTRAGTFLAQLTVTDDKGAVGIATVTITVQDQQVQTQPGGNLPGPPTPPPALPTGDSPIPVTTPSPVPTPDPRRSLLPALPRSSQEGMKMLSQLQELMRLLQHFKGNAKKGSNDYNQIVHNMEVVDSWGRQIATQLKTQWKW